MALIFVLLLLLATQLLLLHAADLPQHSAEGLVRLLMQDFGPVPKYDTARLKADAATGLARIGPPALPEIRKELDSLEAEGEGSRATPGAPWLVYALARIQGPAAYPRLKRILLNPKLTSYKASFERAIAVSLGLTSFRSVLQQKPASAPNVRALPPTMPQDVLDKLILSWIVGDFDSFKGSLSPRTSAQILNRDSWEHCRDTFLGEGDTSPVAFGYKLSLPRELLRSPVDLLPVSPFPGGYNVNPEAQVEFYREDRFCATVQVRFREGSFPTESKQPWKRHFTVDNDDIHTLLRALRPCVFRVATVTGTKAESGRNAEGVWHTFQKALAGLALPPPARASGAN